MKQIDILTTIGRTCNSMGMKDCLTTCPFNVVRNDTRHSCAIDFLYDKKIAKQVLEIVKELQKAEVKNQETELKSELEELEVYKEALKLACWNLETYTDRHSTLLFEEFLLKARESK